LASLEELTEEISENEVIELTSWHHHKSTLQRAGFLLDSSSTELILLQELSNRNRYYSIYYL